jgi:hypothetical protein
VNLLICALLVLTSAQAQSGRRPPKQPTSPDPMPPAQTEPPIQPSTRAETGHRLPILVVRNLPTIGSSSIYTNIALNGCLEELKRSPAVEVASAKDKNRKEASDYAKASTDTYVVLIQLDQDTVDVEHPSVSVLGGNPATLCVSYILFTPGTGKVKTQGKVYQGQRRGPVGLPPGSQASVDYELRRCGREAADRVLDALNFPRPPGR